MASEAEKNAARKIIRERIHSVLDFHDQAAAYSLLDGIDDIVDAALEAAERVRWQPIETARKDEDIWLLGLSAGSKLPVPIFFDEELDRWLPLNGVFKNWQPAHWQPLSSPLEDKTC